MERSKDDLRDAALVADQSVSRVRQQERAQEATDTWRSILRGRCFVVDRFEDHQRGYFLIASSPSTVTNLLSLTQREADVLRHAIRGESHKLIAYRLGLSRSWVTKLLGAAVHKLGLRSQAQLVLQLSSIMQLVDTTPPSECASSAPPSPPLTNRGRR